MRIVPVITAILVAALLFGLVIERDRLFALIDDLSPRETAAEAVEAAGGKMVYLDKERFTEADIGGEHLARWPVYAEVVDADGTRGDAVYTLGGGGGFSGPAFLIHGFQQLVEQGLYRLGILLGGALVILLGQLIGPVVYLIVGRGET